ncbi:hypothetical protein [Aquisphaera giovannonii]|nr:hypothetical protein [Aquisphaera giovannonii]
MASNATDLGSGAGGTVCIAPMPMYGVVGVVLNPFWTLAAGRNMLAAKS